MKSLARYALVLGSMVVIPFSSLLAQVPSQLAVTSVLTNSDGERMDGDFSLTFRLYDGLSAESALWEESQNLILEDGILQAFLGSVEPLNLPFDTTYFLGISVDGGTELSPRIALSAAAYSITSKYLGDQALVAGDNVSIARNEMNQLVVSAAGAGEPMVGHTLNAADGSPEAAVYVDEEGRVGVGRKDPMAEASLSVNGPISFTDRPDSASSAENPLMYVFESYRPYVSRKPLRGIFALSAEAPDWGLFAEDYLLHFMGEGRHALTVRLDSQYVGINDPFPTEALSVGGVVESQQGGFRFPDGTIQTSAAAGAASVWSSNNNKIFYNNGFVGIGTDNPLSRLHVSGGDLEIQDDFPVLALNGSNSNKIVSFQFNGSEQGSLIFSNGLGLRGNAGADFTTGSWVLSTSGNFGLGLNSPQRKLHVHFDNNNGITSQMLISQAGTGDAWMNFGLDGGPHYAVGVDNSDGDKFKIGYHPTEPRGVADNTRVTINSVGRVGLGVSDPRVKLDVAGALKLGTTDVTDNGILRYTGSDFEGHQNGQWVSLTAGSLWNQVGSNVFYSAGRVGVGTSAPRSNLSLSRQTQAAAYQLELRNVGSITNGNFDGIEFTQGVTGSTRLASMQLQYQSNGQPNLAFNLRSNNNVLLLEAGGNVGVNTSNPSEKLDVNGNIRASGEIRRSATGAANMVPICYGSIDANGSIHTSSGNFSVSKTATGRYTISINGENVFFEDYIVSVTLAGDAGMATYSSAGGNLRINTFNLIGVVLAADRDFSFVVYKP